jgi:hypothetical protein
MVLIVLLLLCSCLCCLREGVWTKYTPEDVARWKAHSTAEKAVPRLPSRDQELEGPRLPRSAAGAPKGFTLRRETPASPHLPAYEYRARVA